SGETPQALAPRRLAETPTESEAPGAEINRQIMVPYTCGKKQGVCPFFRPYTYFFKKQHKFF
ncbi:hypothetical protein ABES03_23725, partial [Neobacillus rhizosphaerae]